MKRFCLLCLIAVLSCCFRAAADAPVPVLCLASEDAATQGLTDLDPKAVAAYREQGFELHFGYYQKVTRDELMRYPVVVGMCADNQNSICSVSRAPEKFVRDERELYLQHSYWHTGQAQGQLGVMRDARQLVPRVIESGIVQPCKYVRPMPRLELADGGVEDHTDSKMTIAAASGEGNRIRYEFQIPGGILSSRADLTAFRPSADGGDTAVLVELAVRAERDLAATEIASLELFSFGLMPPFPANWRYRVETAPGQFADGMLSNAKVPVTLPLAPFGAAALYPNNLAEPVLLSLNAEPLEVRLDVVKFWNCRERLTVLLPKSGWKKGEERKFSFVMYS